MYSLSRGGILKSNLTSGLPTRVFDWDDYEGTPIEPCNDFYLPRSSKSPLVIPWIYKYQELSRSARGRKRKFECQRKVAKDLSLHEEIVAFIEYMKPTGQEIKAREDLVDRFTKLLQSFKVSAWPPEPYGSYITGLFLATSDIDMVFTPREYTTQKSALGKVLRRLIDMPPPQFHKGVRDVLKASVPLLTITDQKTGLAVDLTAEPLHAKASTRVVVDWLKQDTARGDEAIIKMLVLVVKVFLAIRRSGSTYTGGVNSYVVVWLVIAWVKLELPKMRSMSKDSGSDEENVDSLISGLMDSSMNDLTCDTDVDRDEQQKTTKLFDPNYGDILISFFKFYGQEFDYTTTKISFEPETQYIPKSGFQPQSFLLSIIDPADSSIDLGKKAYAIKHVMASFKQAYIELEQLENARACGNRVGEQGILGKVLGGDFEQFWRQRMQLVM